MCSCQSLGESMLIYKEKMDNMAYQLQLKEHATVVGSD